VILATFLSKSESPKDRTALLENFSRISQRFLTFHSFVTSFGQ
jgi:hypothetical protein